MITLKIGDKGDDVKALQDDLIVRGFNINADGFFGIQTRTAVETFQENNKLDPDGIVGDATWAALFSGPTPVKSTEVLGVDTSYYQGAFDWAKGVADGLVFMMTKGSEGKTIIDPDSTELINGAGAAGIKFRGLYHFFHANDTVADQVSLFMGVYDKIKASLEFAPILDLEEASIDGLPYAQVADLALAWLQSVELQTGKVPILYIDENMISLLKLDSRFAKYTPWIAVYSGSAPTSLGPWDKWVFWQYTDSGEQSSDTDKFNGSLADLEAFIG